MTKSIASHCVTPAAYEIEVEIGRINMQSERNC
jgi:hypothetical protein